MLSRTMGFGNIELNSKNHWILGRSHVVCRRNVHVILVQCLLCARNIPKPFTNAELSSAQSHLIVVVNSHFIDQTSEVQRG